MMLCTCKFNLNEGGDETTSVDVHQKNNIKLQRERHRVNRKGKEKAQREWSSKSSTEKLARRQADEEEQDDAGMSKQSICHQKHACRDNFLSQQLSAVSRPLLILPNYGFACL